MIRARGPLPASPTARTMGQSAVLFRVAPENRLQLGGIIVLISLCWNLGLQTPPPVVMDFAYNWLCKEHLIDETDLQSPMLVSQAVPILITPLELSASISMANYVVLYLQNVTLPCVSCKFQIGNPPGTLLRFYRLFTLLCSSNIILLDIRHGT
jgi:hypothetical protein